MYNAAERKDIRRAEKAAKLDESNRIQFVVAAMSTMPGRAWFFDFLSSCHIFNDPFTGNALLEAHTKGERNVGLKVYNDIVSNCPDYFVVMMKEASAKEQANVNIKRSSSPDSDDTAEWDPYSDPTDELAGSENATR